MKLIILGILMTIAGIDSTHPRQTGISVFMFDIQPNGNVSRVLEHYVGQVNVEHCIAHCGCKEMPYGGWNETTRHCFCGYAEAEACNGRGDCLESLDTSSIDKPAFSSIIPIQAKMFENISIDIVPGDNIINYGILTNGKLTKTAYTSNNVMFTEYGNVSIATEHEAYWACRSETNYIQVVPPVEAFVKCPVAAIAGDDFICDGTIVSGTDIIGLTWEKDGATQTTIDLTDYNIEPMHYYTGAILRTDRFNEYEVSYNGSDGQRRAYIDINYEFTSNGILKAFEAYITETGCVRFMILKPTCVGEEFSYCNSLKKCVDNTISCGDPNDLMSYTPPNADFGVFCSDALRFTNETLITCPRVEGPTTPMADYEIMWQYETVAYTLGNSVFTIPSDQYFVVKPGYVTGWAPCEGVSAADIGHYPMDDTFGENWPTYVYDEVFAIADGATFSSLYPMASTEEISFMIQAHVFSTVFYTETFTATTAGSTLTVGVSLETSTKTSPIATSEVLIFENITGISPVFDKVYFYEGATVNLNIINLDTGIDGAEYCVHWGETDYTGTCDETSLTSTFTHQYNVPVGIYSVYVKASNLLSTDDIIVPLEVLGTIDTLAYVEQIETVQVNEVSHIRIEGSGTGSAYLKVIIDEDLYEFNVTMAPNFVFNFDIRSDSDVATHALVIVGNALESKQVSSYMVVQSPIVGLDISPYPISSTNESYIYTLVEHAGTNVTYMWDFGDGTIVWTNGSFNVRQMAHTYVDFGLHTIFVNSWNFLGIANITFDVMIQDKIGGLEFTRDNMDGQFGEPTIVSFLVSQGSGINITIDYGYNNIHSPLAIDMDVAGTAVYGQGSYMYPVMGIYTVMVKLISDVSSINITKDVIVAYKISELNVSMVQELEGSSFYNWIEEGERLTICANATGSNIIFMYNFGDGRPNITTENQTVEVSYTQWREKPYIVTVVATNPISELTKLLTVHVQQPVQNMTGFSLSNAPGNASEPIEFVLTILTGDLFNCTWDWSDGTTPTLVLYNDFLLHNGAISHIFESGVFMVDVACKNRLYNLNLTIETVVYAAVTPFDIYVWQDCKDGVGLKPGQGETQDVYDINCEIVFTLDGQGGTNVTNLFDLGYVKDGKAVVVIGGPSNETKHQYVITDSTLSFIQPTITVTASNPTSSYIRSTQITIIDGIKNVTIKLDDGINRIGTPSNISVHVESLAYQACYEIDLGDPRIEIAKIVIGDEICKSKPQYAFHTYIEVTLIPGELVYVTSHTYPDIGTYNLAVSGQNDVSAMVHTEELKIKDLPCFKPKLAWDAAITMNVEDAVKEASFFKCRRYPLLTKTIRDCQKTTAFFQRSWKLSQITHINETGEIIINKTIEVPGNDTRYVITERHLEYGLYELQYIVSMYDSERDEMVEDTEEILSGYFVIKRCDLIGKINGGSGRAVGQGSNAVINASESMDPDKEPGEDHELTFEWFCKRDNKREEDKEYFDLDNPALINYPSEIHKAAKNKSEPRTDFYGCLGNGHGKMNFPKTNPAILELDTNYMLYSQEYNIWLRISQAGRRETVQLKYLLKVVFGEPPIVSISCKLNCLTKKNPTQKISFVAVCDNCGSNKPIYQWSMISRTVGAIDALQDKNESVLLRQSATTDIMKDQNLVISPNSLIINTEYVVQLSVYWDLNEPENGGFSQYFIEVNSPPVVGEFAECYFNIDKGIALMDGFFITCESITDEDTPLTYHWFYRVKQGETDEWKTCTFPRQGPPQSDTFTLPAGDPDRQNMVSIKVIVEDLYGAKSDPLLFEVQVDPKVIDSAAVDNLLDDPAAMSDPAVMGNVMNGLLDSMSSNPESVKVDVGAVKDKMIAMLAEVRIDSPAGCTMVASTLDSAANGDEGMSDDGVESSLQATGNIASFGLELSPEQLQEIAKKVLSAAAKFTKNIKGEKAGDTMNAARESELALTAGQAANMVAGEAPSAMVTANGVTEVSCVDPKNKQAGGIGGFELPDIPGDEDIPDGSCTGATNSAGADRYGFEESAKGVHGDTMGLSLSAGFGNQKVVANLPKPIRIVMPNKDPIPPPESHPAYCELMRVIHLVECNVNASNLFMKIQPWYDNFTGNFFVFMNKGTTPSLADSQHNCTLPIPYPDNFDNMTEAQQTHFETEVKWRCTVSAEQMENYCEGRWCVGVVYYTNSTNRTDELKPRSYPVADAQCKKLNYTFYAYTRACLYWSKSNKRYQNDGCIASDESKDNETVCYCDHLTDFGGGGPFAEPQPIDFGAAFSGFSNLGENPTVFSVVLALIVVYFLMIIWARWKDKKDAIKVATCPLESNHPNDTYFYELNVQTGYKNSSSTTSEVFIVLRGSQSETLPKQLRNPDRPCFIKGETDNFLLAVPYTLGKLKEVEVWHNNKGSSPGWFLMQVAIRDLQTDKNTLFVCNKWLDVAEDDGLICRTMEAALKEELTEFSFAFAQTMRKNLYDGHIWFSVFTRPLSSTFTRVQRLSTCFSLLLTTMLANAMFYTGDDKPASGAIVIGPVSISIDQIRVGITSALVVIPANLLIITLFKKAGPKRDKTAEKYMEEEEEEEVEEEKEEEIVVAAPLPRKSVIVSASQLIVGTEPQPIVATGPQPIEPVLEPGYTLTEEEEPTEEEIAAKRQKQGRFVRFVKSILFPGREDDDVEKESKRKNPLPHWLIYIAYFFVFVTCAASAFFVILYGFTFGKEKSDQWIISMTISFLQSVFMIQPIKVVVLSLIFAYMTKDPTKDDGSRQRTKLPGQATEDELDSDVDEELEEEAKNAHLKKKNPDTFKMPDERRLEESRQQRVMEKRIKAIIKEIVVHLMFVMVCLMVAYAASDPASYHLAASVRHLAEKNGVTKSYFGGKTYNEELGDRVVKEADKIGNRLEWLDWMRFSVVEYLFPIGWYNGDKDYKAGFVADNEPSKVLAMARIRQLRVKNNTCTKLPTFEHLIVECNAAYSMSSVEQTNHFHYGWTPALNRSSLYRLRRGKRKALYLGYESPWRHSSAAELNAFPFFGKFAIYNGASYSVSIGPKKKFAKKIVAALKDNFWVDRYTRALITEANIYNANTNLLLIVTMIHEILPTGGWNFYYNIQSLRLYRYVGGLGSVIMVFDFIFAIITIVGLYRAIKYSKRRGFMKYINNLWNLLHVVVTGFSLGAIGCTIGRALSVRGAVAQYLDEPELFVSFAYVGQLEYLIMACIGFIVFFANLEFLRILRFNRRIGLLTKTMSIVGKPLSSFAILFCIIFMGYVSFAHCIFADKLEGFSSFMTSFVALMKMFLGQFSWDDFQNNAPILGPLMFFTYMLAIQMILINMFIGIVCDAFASVREEEDMNEDTNVLSFIGDKLKTVTGAGNNGPAMPIYMEWKTDWELMMEKFEEQCDGVIYNIKNVESDEIRNNKWFNPKHATGKKRKMLAAILGVDYLMYETEVLDGLQALERKMKRMTEEECNTFLHAAVLKRSDDLALEEQNGRSTACTDQSYDDDDDDEFTTSDEEEDSDFENDGK